MSFYDEYNYKRKSSLDNPYGDYNTQDQMPSMANSSDPSEGAMAAKGGLAAASWANPAIALGGSFLMNYLEQKAKEREQEKANRIAIAQQQAQGESAGLNKLGDYWKSALLK